MVADLQFATGRSLDIITQAVTLGSYAPDIVGDYARYTAAAAMVETADRLTDHDGSLQQYVLLIGALRSLARGEHAPTLILDSYLLRALSIAGWAPSFGDCAVTGEPGPHTAFSPQLGGMVSSEAAPPGSARLAPETVTLLGALLVGDWEVADASPNGIRNAASAAVGAYVQFHLERGLRSLQHIERNAT